jgi:hypothetical protein
MSDLKELEASYSEAMRGSESPDYIVIFCPDCQRSFELYRGGPNEVCEHILSRHSNILK